MDNVKENYYLPDDIHFNCKHVKRHFVLILYREHWQIIWLCHLSEKVAYCFRMSDWHLHKYEWRHNQNTFQCTLWWYSQFQNDRYWIYFNRPGLKNSKPICGTVPNCNFLFGFMKSYIIHTFVCVQKSKIWIGINIWYLLLSLNT